MGTNHRSRQNGLTLVELMVGIAILGIVGAAVMNISTMSSQSSAKFTHDTDVNYFVGDVTAHLADPNNCLETFKDPVTKAQLLTPSSIISRIYNDNAIPPVPVSMNRVLYAKGDPNSAPFGASHLEILGYEMPAPANPGDDTNLQLRIKGKAFGRKGDILRDIAMDADWDFTTTPKKLLRCRSMAQASTELWSRGTGTNIYYSGGTVSIGAISPSPTPTPIPTDVALFVSGDMAVSSSITANSFYYSSDRRFKEEIQSIENPVQRVSLLRGVSFDWRQDKRHDYGFIAQEIQGQIPEIVHQDKRGFLSVDYVKVLPFLVEALKKQQQEIEELKNEVERLKK